MRRYNTVYVIVAIEDRDGEVTDDIFWFGRPRLIEDLFIGRVWQILPATSSGAILIFIL